VLLWRLDVVLLLLLGEKVRYAAEEKEELEAVDIVSMATVNEAVIDSDVLLLEKIEYSFKVVDGLKVESVDDDMYYLLYAVKNREKCHVEVNLTWAY
jgi:hypothetical protein